MLYKIKCFLHTSFFELVHAVFLTSMQLALNGMTYSLWEWFNAYIYNIVKIIFSILFNIAFKHTLTISRH